MVCKKGILEDEIEQNCCIIGNSDEIDSEKFKELIFKLGDIAGKVIICPNFDIKTAKIFEHK